jgi:hypothetical protein
LTIPQCDQLPILGVWDVAFWQIVAAVLVFAVQAYVNPVLVGSIVTVKTSLSLQLGLVPAAAKAWEPPPNMGV